MSYEGKVETDGNSITGALIQGTNALPLPLRRATAETAWELPTPPAAPKGPPEGAKLESEIATIKPSVPDAQGAPFRVSPGRIEILNRSLASLIKETERYDIAGKPASAGQPNIGQLRQLLRSLLAERFNLKFHMEEKELSVYAIGMGGTGQHELRAASIQSALPLGDLRGVQFQFGGRAGTMPTPPNIDALPDLFAAFQEQLGLRIEATKATTNVFVIDSAQRASEN